jgi:hypothetical protein
MSMALVCLLLGSALYVFFRPTTLLMFQLADALGLTSSIGVMRDWMAGFDCYLPKWIIFSLPFALWVSAYLLFINSIWMNSTSLSRHVWFWCIPLVAIIAELAQIKHIIPGTFDVTDFVVIIVAIIFGFSLTLLFNRIEKEKRYYD